MPKAEEPVVIYRAANAQQAALLRNLLEERGIAAWVQDMIQTAVGDLPLGWRGDSQVVVSSRDAVVARNLALEFEDQLRLSSSRPEVDDAPIYAATDTWDNWPTCPECGQRRHTRCPLCGQAGDAFPLVDLERTERGEVVLLMCQPCDEPFRPKFYRYCHQCGHDFGHGLAAPGQGATGAEVATDFDRQKVLIVVGAMLVIGLGLAAYFSFLFAR